MDWLIIGGKITGKVALNLLTPGAGTAVDFAEATYDAYNGNYVGAAMNVAFGVFDLVTLGTASTVKDITKDAAKKSATTTVKQTAKSTTKVIGDEARKKIAQGFQKDLVVDIAKNSAKAAKKDIGRQFGKEIGMGMIEDTVEEAFKKSFKREIAEGTLNGLLGSGGQNIGKEVFANVGYNILSKATEGGAKTAFKSTTADAAKHVAKEFAYEYNKTTLQRGLVLNGVKCVTNRYTNDF